MPQQRCVLRQFRSNLLQHCKRLSLRRLSLLRALHGCSVRNLFPYTLNVVAAAMAESRTTSACFNSAMSSMCLAIDACTDQLLRARFLLHRSFLSSFVHSWMVQVTPSLVLNLLVRRPHETYAEILDHSFHLQKVRPPRGWQMLPTLDCWAASPGPGSNALSATFSSQRPDCK